MNIDYHSGIMPLGLVLWGHFVLADHTESLIMASVIYQPGNSLKIYFANCIAMAEHEVHSESVVHSSNHSENINTESVKNHVLRIGSGYYLHNGSFTLTPTINWDRIDGHSEVSYGAAFGI
jgi:hypothetical protein